MTERKEKAYLVSFSLQVFDQYLNYISLEDEMFTVRNQDRDSISYYGKSAIYSLLSFRIILPAY